MDGRSIYRAVPASSFDKLRMRLNESLMLSLSKHEGATKFLMLSLSKHEVREI